MNEVLQRVTAIWKPDFLKRSLKKELEGQKSQKTTWLFWFLTSALAAVVWTIIAVIWLSQEIPQAVQSLDEFIPQDAKIQMDQGILMTENIEPFRHEMDTDSGDKALFVIDTTENAEISIETLESYESGAIVLRDKFYVKDNTDITTERFDNVPNFSLTKDQLMGFVESQKSKVIGILGVVIFFFSFSLLAFLRLLTAWWWTMILMLFAKVFGLKADIRVFYFVVLNLYFIPLVIEGVLLMLHVNIPFSTTLIFAVLFAMNISEWKKDNKDNNVAQQETIPVPQDS